MNQESSFSGAEIVGIAAVAAASLGGIIVALGRSQSAAAKSNAPAHASIPEAARHQLEHGRVAARTAAAVVADAYPGIRDGAADLLSRAVETAGPQASRASEVAAARAKTARASGTQALGRLQDVVIPAASGALGSIREHASDASLKRSAPAGVVARSGEIADAAVTKSTNALRETAALVFWLSAAFSLVYFVLLNEERREKLLSVAIGAYEQTRLLVQDFQGYDEDI